MEAVPDKYKCSICMKVLRDARLVDCCGQHYCDSCLEEWINSKNEKTCPNCRKKNFQSILNRERIREINELRVRCSNSHKGCEWEGEIKALKEHLESDNGCEYETVYCRKSSSGTSPVISTPLRVSSFMPGQVNTASTVCHCNIERRYLAKHQEKECKYRQYTCEHCGYEDTFEAVAGRKPRVHAGDSVRNHYDECPNYPRDCPNKCGEKNIKRKNMRSHRNECILEPLKCPFHNVGCTDRIKRKDMDVHRHQNMEKHLELLAESHERLAQIVDKRYVREECEEEELLSGSISDND